MWILTPLTRSAALASIGFFAAAGSVAIFGFVRSQTFCHLQTHWTPYGAAFPPYCDGVCPEDDPCRQLIDEWPMHYEFQCVCRWANPYTPPRACNAIYYWWQWYDAEGHFQYQSDVVCSAHNCLSDCRKILSPGPTYNAVCNCP